MRRILAGALLVAMVAQTSGAALARTDRDLAPSTSLANVIASVLAVVEGSSIVAQLTGNGDRYAAMHAAKPVFARSSLLRPSAKIDVRKSRLAPMRFRQGRKQVMHYAIAPPRHHVRDPLAMRSAIPRTIVTPHSVAPLGSKPLQVPSVSHTRAGSIPRLAASATNSTRSGASLFTVPGRPREKMGQAGLASSDVGAGINSYWEYEERPLPGIGKAMVNVGTGNLVVQAVDVAIPEAGLGLVFQRTYNSQSLHDASGDDGAEPNIFGNGWTNTYDAHIVYQPSTGDISVYDIDGTRCDYAGSGGSWTACAGEHAQLEPDPDNPCSYWWVKKNGTAYWFHTDDRGPNCNFGQGETGRLYKIVGRNSNNAVTLAYSFSGQETSENITEIDVNHSDGQSLIMKFGQANGTGPTELGSIQYVNPNGGQDLKITYSYDAQGDLQEVDRPGNNTASTLPETYGIQHPMQFACGPRATIYKQAQAQGLNPPPDGSCLNIDYDTSDRVADWKVNGVLNINPGNGYGVIQPSPAPTGWQTAYMANFVYGATQGGSCQTTYASTTTMCDVDGHSVIWTIDSASRVTQVQSFVNSTLSLVTNQTWDVKNNLVAFADPNNHVTDYAYDANGNTIAVKHPQPQPGINPTEVFAYDSNNNLLAYCDPVYSDTHGLDWSSGSWPGTECPQVAGTTHYSWSDTTGGNEPFGMLTNASTACYQANCQDGFKAVTEPGYSVQYTYNSRGLPTEAQGISISQPTGSRRPTQLFTYDAYGNLQSYTNGNEGTWTLNYDTLNRLTSQVDPDPGHPTSYFYYNDDGSTRLTETPHQHANGNGHVFNYDADGDETSQTTHFRNTLATTYKYYDGLDRLVEVDEPYDGYQQNDVFTNPWITRYFYDLTEGGTVKFNGSSPFSAYGNLFQTQELLPTGGHTSTYTGAQTINNNGFEPLKGTQYDALDRPVGAYAVINGGNSLTTTTYDGHGEYGLPTHQCRPDPTGGQNPMCRTFYHDNDNRLSAVDYQDGPSTKRNFTYDIAGHELTEQLSDNNKSYTETYYYDLEGRVVNTKEPDVGTFPGTKYTHEFYGDGKLMQLDVNNPTAPLQLPGLFGYSYNDDGHLKEQTISYSSATAVTVDFTYTSTGRPYTRTEKGAGVNNESLQTSWGYNPLGELVSTTYPEEPAIQDYTYDAEGDLRTFNGTTYYYTVRGELLGTEAEGGGILGYPGTFSMANGAQVQTVTNKSYNSQWDNRMGVMTQLISDPGSSDEATTSYGYDAAGRDAGEGSNSCTGQCQSNTIVTTSTGRSYDFDDHTVDTKQSWLKTATIGGGASANVSVYDWGPTDHPVRIGSADSTTTNIPPDDTAASYDTLHWDGDQLIFSTNPQHQVDDVKVGSSGDITPATGQGYNGITFWDRGPGGAVVYCHNATGSSGTGQVAIYPIAMTAYSSPCAPPLGQQGTGTFPAGITWFTGPSQAPATAGKPRSGGVGQGAIVGMYRPDGISDGANTIQGVRTTDSASGNWTTPDAFPGMIGDPTSQLSYQWEDNNPLAYLDVSGFDAQIGDNATAQSGLEQADDGSPSQQSPDSTGDCGGGMINVDGTCVPDGHVDTLTIGVVSRVAPWLAAIIAYRAISFKEETDINESGFRPNPSGDGYQFFKLFFTNKDDAVKHGKTFRLPRMVRARIPDGGFEKMESLNSEEVSNPDEPAIQVPTDVLKDVMPEGFDAIDI